MLERLKLRLNTSWLKVAALVAVVSTAAYAAQNFKSINVNGNIAVTGTVDGRDVSTDGSVIDAITANGVTALTSVEVDQLENINATVISSSTWGFLGGINQSLATTASPTFNSITGTLATAAQPNVTSTGTLTAFSLNSFFDVLQQATPANPAASRNRLYFKSDDKLYRLTSAGAEAEVGGAGANTALSNLAATAVNVSIVPGVGGVDLGSDANNNRYDDMWIAAITLGDIAKPGAIDFRAGNPLNSYGTIKNTGTLPSGATATWNFESGLTADSDPIGMWTRNSPAFPFAIPSGFFNIETGNTTHTGNNANTGAILIKTGNAIGTVSGGDSGAITLQTGTSVSGTRGAIKLVNGSAAAVGHIWTATNTDGSGTWSAPASGGANTTLSNLGTTAINANLIFSSALSAYTISTAATAARNLFINSGSQTANSSATGNVEMITGNSSGTGSWSGNLTLKSGTGTAGGTGNILLGSGDASSSGPSGDVTISTGTTAGTRGKIIFVNGSQGTTGHVWTSTGTGGQGGWAVNAAASFATQAEQETGTATNTAVTPGRQQFHPSAAKAWVYYYHSGGVPTILVSYNVTSLTDVSAGVTDVNFTTAFSGVNYAIVTGYVSGNLALQNQFDYISANTTASKARLRFSIAGTETDNTNGLSAVFYGDQ